MRWMRCCHVWRRSTRAWGTAPSCRRAQRRWRLLTLHQLAHRAGVGLTASAGRSGQCSDHTPLLLLPPVPLVHLPVCLQEEANAKALQALPLCRNDGERGNNLVQMPCSMRARVVHGSTAFAICLLCRRSQLLPGCPLSAEVLFAAPYRLHLNCLSLHLP